MAPELDGWLWRARLSQGWCLQLSIKMKIQLKVSVSDKNFSSRQQRFGLAAGGWESAWQDLDCSSDGISSRSWGCVWSSPGELVPSEVRNCS